MMSGCGAAGSALDWGSRGRKFKSCHSDHVEAKFTLLRFFYAKNPPTATLIFFFYKKLRSACLLGCKRHHDNSLSLPTFCKLFERLRTLAPIRKPLYLCKCSSKAVFCLQGGGRIFIYKGSCRSSRQLQQGENSLLQVVLRTHSKARGRRFPPPI